MLYENTELQQFHCWKDSSQHTLLL